MKKILVLTSILFCGLFCSPAFAKVPQPTVLEIRETQTHYFDTQDTTKVMKAVVHTLQDNGFIIVNGDMDLGYMSAVKEFKAKRTDKGRVALYSAEYAYYITMTALSFGINAPFLIIPSMHMKNELAMHPVVIRTNITFDKVGKKTKVRMNIIEKILENADGYTKIKSAPRKVVRHNEQELYQEFFNQVGKNLFIENNKI